MHHWNKVLISNFMHQISQSNLTRGIYSTTFIESSRIHLAVFSEPFLSYMISGKKSIDSRFSVNKLAPYDQVFCNDIVLVKKSGGPVIGMFLVSMVNYFSDLDLETLDKIKVNYGKFICASHDSDFWKLKAKSKFATLIGISYYKTISPINVLKKDRRAWVIVKH